MARPFNFKQFSIQQKNSAFKVGTDSVLLGSWIDANEAGHILDIGAGTGVLSLMMAQRNSKAQVLAIEVDRDSSDECQLNFTNSPWSDRLNIYEGSALNWLSSKNSSAFDLILTNPPYFTNSLLSPDSRKTQARHSDEFNAQLLAKLAAKAGRSDVKLGLVLPVTEYDYWHSTLVASGLKLNRKCELSSFKDGQIIRVLLEYSFKADDLTIEREFIYKGVNVRSDWYNNLSRDFYL